YSAGFV
ncbi:hypothetical protein VCEM1676A_003056B, partial [Vibrio cholerae O1 str. EM-1676A]